MPDVFGYEYRFCNKGDRIRSINYCSTFRCELLNYYFCRTSPSAASTLAAETSIYTQTSLHRAPALYSLPFWIAQTTPSIPPPLLQDVKFTSRTTNARCCTFAKVAMKRNHLHVAEPLLSRMASRFRPQLLNASRILHPIQLVRLPM